MDITFIVSPQTIYHLIKEENNLIFATDGGAIKFKGSLGFVLTTEDGTKLLTSYGQPAGHDPLSYQSEIYAFLAALRLINLLVQHYDEVPTDECKIKSIFHLYTDTRVCLIN